MSITRTGYGRTGRAGELCFSISNDLTQMVNFPIQIPDWDSRHPALLDLFLSADTSICSTTAFPPLENCNHVVVSVSIDWLSNKLKTRFPVSSHSLWLF